MRRITWFLGWGVCALALGACSSDANDKSDAEYRAEITNGMHDSIGAEIAVWKKAAQDLVDAAPSAAGRGWDPTLDAAAITAMKDAWKRVRVPYEHIEGALAPLFPEGDFAVDARYDDFLAERNGKGDDNPFDGEGVTGQHAIERILFADSIPTYVVSFESKLPGYKAARFPATEQEASDFKTKLCAQLVTDIESIETDWKASNTFDLGGAYQGLVALMNEQGEKVNKAATQEEESRYSQRTLADLHANLEGTEKIYKLFQPWIVAKANGGQADTNIQTGFNDLRTAYSANTGDGIPQPPTGWSSIDPKPADLDTPFGKLFTTVNEAVDPAREGSVVDQMNKAAKLIGLPVFTPEP